MHSKGQFNLARLLTYLVHLNRKFGVTMCYSTKTGQGTLVTMTAAARKAVAGISFAFQKHTESLKLLLQSKQ